VVVGLAGLWVMRREARGGDVLGWLRRRGKRA